MCTVLGQCAFAKPSFSIFFEMTVVASMIKNCSLERDTVIQKV